MEDLRSLYTVDLSGLHSRTFQLKKFMGQISPDLLEHITNLGLEMAYLSQWFMTLYATSCPLNILFRIYDVVFAEGPDETIMRVALALILSNEEKIMQMTELEELLQLLLGRRLWEPYLADPDFLMDEIARLSNLVTCEELNKLELQFAEQSSGESGDKTVRALGFTSGFGAFRLFDHFRTPSISKTAPRSQSTTTLLEMPGHVPRRSVSKRSTCTIDSSSGSGSGADSLMSAESQPSTAATEADKDVERSSLAASKSGRKQEDRGLEDQVEGLLMALQEVQREAAETAAQLQQENRRKESMAEIVLRLRDLITQKEQAKDARKERRKTMPSRVDIDNAQDTLRHLRRKSIIINDAARSVSVNNLALSTPSVELQESLQRLCSILETEPNSLAGTPRSEHESFIGPAERSTRSRRRDSVRFDASREGSQPGTKSPQSQMSRQDSPHMVDSTRTTIAKFDTEDFWPGPALAESPTSGPAVQHIHQPRKSSLQAREVLRASGNLPPAEDALLIELVNAKTREATAMHERDEMKVQIDKMRRANEAALAREAAVTAKLAEMERLIAAQRLAFEAQDSMHNAELARLRDVAATPRTVTRSRPGTPSPAEKLPTLWPAAMIMAPEVTTPTKLQIPAPDVTPTGSGWGWFSKKGRSVSTGGVP